MPAQSIPRNALYRGRRVRILHYEGDGEFRILCADDSQRTVSREQLVFMKG